MEAKKILITGGSGFIGSNLVDALVTSNRNYKIYVIDSKEPGYPNSGVNYEKIDIISKDIPHLINSIAPDIILHLAAQASVAFSAKDPAYDGQVNIVGSLNILQSSIQSGTNKFIFFSTGGAIYGENIEKRFKEDDELNPKSPYGISKYSFERYLNYFGDSGLIKTTTIRPSNVYGPRQNPDGEAGVISIFGKKMINNDPVTIFGSGEEFRDYIFVEDVINFVTETIENDIYGSYNVCSGEIATTFEIYKYLSELTGYTKPPIYKNSRDGDVIGIKLDNTKARQVASWSPSVSLDSGLKRTIDSLKAESDS